MGDQKDGTWRLEAFLIHFPVLLVAKSREEGLGILRREVARGLTDTLISCAHEQRRHQIIRIERILYRGQ